MNKPLISSIIASMAGISTLVGYIGVGWVAVIALNKQWQSISISWVKDATSTLMIGGICSYFIFLALAVIWDYIKGYFPGEDFEIPSNVFVKIIREEDHIDTSTTGYHFRVPNYSDENLMFYIYGTPDADIDELIKTVKKLIGKSELTVDIFLQNKFLFK